jgi:single-strand DNA-binding protein
MSVNKAILLGRLGKDPELKYTQSGKAVANFSLATSERWKGQDGQSNEATTWHNIVAWGKTAEVMKEYFHKGKEIYIEGRIDNRSYEDKEGNRKYISEVVVQNFSFVGSRSDAGNGGNAGGGDGGGGGQAPSGGDAPSAPPQGNAGGGDDDLPF